jgi:hypothetical protein
MQINVNLDTLYEEQDKAIKNVRQMPTYLPGKSIVTSSYRQELPSTFVLLTELNRLEFNIPIEVFYRENELNDDEISELTKINPALIQCKKIASECPNFTDRYNNNKGWGVKTYAIVESAYQENLWIDGDNVPIKNCMYLFDDPEYKTKGSLFWRDVYSIDRSNQYCDTSSFWKIFNVPPNDGEPFESGQFILNKPVVWNQINLMLHFTDNSNIYFNFGGDAECWRMAWQLYSIKNNQYFSAWNYHASEEVPYGFIPYGPFHKGAVNPWKKYGGGSVMVQRDRNGHEIFNHRNLTKWNWQKNIFNEDITNEQTYHMIINHLKYKYNIKDKT